ncbi:MAG TPA: RNA methyltransferase [Trueperaceae bacterium]|nr:RNA methyltransferase [Trueperaceae bacterium]
MRRRVDSPRNPLVAETFRLRDHRHRARTGLFLVEGAREVERALAAGVPPRTLLLAPDLAPRRVAEPLAAAAAAAGAEVVELSASAFARLSLRQGPDGVALVARAPDRRLEAAGELAGGLVLVLDGLEKPGNVGALLRTADAVGAAAVILTGAGTDVENPNVIRASQGSVFAVPVHVSSAAAAVDRLRSEGFRLVAASPRAGRAHWEADLTGAVALLLGAEDRGLPAELEAAADELITVPMRSRAADSLNVSVAGAVVLYEALRQRST